MKFSFYEHTYAVFERERKIERTMEVVADDNGVNIERIKYVRIE